MKTQEFKSNKQFDMANEVSIIGKTYLPNDNSWQINISQHDNGGKMQNDSLAGIYNEPAKETTIITEPFKVNVFWMGKYREKEFVIVNDSKGDSHMTLFHEDCIR